MVDRIIVLNDGTISESGTYEELISRDGDFARFLHQYILDDVEEEADVEGKCGFLCHEIIYLDSHCIQT